MVRPALFYDDYSKLSGNPIYQRKGNDAGKAIAGNVGFPALSGKPFTREALASEYFSNFCFEDQALKRLVFRIDSALSSGVLNWEEKGRIRHEMDRAMSLIESYGLVQLKSSKYEPTPKANDPYCRRQLEILIQEFLINLDIVPNIATIS